MTWLWRATLAALVVAAGTGASGQASASPVPASTFGSVGRWITYPDGRVFIGHGFNSVVTRPPYYNAWFGKQDVRFLANQGFTIMRINFLPEALEPAIGELDPSYAERFVRRVALLGRNGIATLLTLNQDRYAESCGGDGFPAWTVLAPCVPPDPSPPWGAFWQNSPAEDGVGLQEHYFAWWTAVAPRFAASPSLLGFDLMNEPGAPNDEALGSLWPTTIAAIRKVDPRHLAFTEPRDPAFPGFGGARLPARTGFAGHVYCAATLVPELRGETPAAATIDRCIAEDAVALRRQIAFAHREKLALLVGEFGASDELREQTALVDAMADSFVPWAVYAYNGKQDGSGAPAQTILRDEDEPGSVANAKKRKLDAFVIPYPMAIAGTPRSWHFDRATRRVRFSYSTRRVGGGAFSGLPRTVVFVPQRVYPTGYAVRAEGARVISSATAPWLELVAERGARVVNVMLSPLTGSFTRTPIAVNQCGYDLAPCGIR